MSLHGVAARLFALPPSFNFRATTLWAPELGAPIAFHSRRALRRLSARQAGDPAPATLPHSPPVSSPLTPPLARGAQAAHAMAQTLSAASGLASAAIASHSAPAAAVPPAEEEASRGA